MAQNIIALRADKVGEAVTDVVETHVRNGAFENDAQRNSISDWATTMEQIDNDRHDGHMWLA